MTININSGKNSRALKTVIYGTEGIGKSTLAAQFPSPLFLDMEGGTDQMDVRRIEKPAAWQELLNIVREVAQTPGICETLVLDTADWSEQLCIEHICKSNNVKSIESFGYGKGYTFIGEEWSKLLTAFDQVIAAGMNVTVIAHAKQRKIELPDQAGAFDHWEMKVSRQVAPLLKEWADLLLFLNYKTTIVTTDTHSKKATGGKRVMYTSHSPIYDAKNRHNLPEELPLDFSGIAQCFQPTAAPQKTGMDRLRELMEEAGITEYQVRAIAEERNVKPEDFVKWGIKYFDSIVKMIKENEK